MHCLETVRNVSAVTGACLVMRRDLYRQIGGLDETNLPVACNDIDLCLKARAAGYRTVWTPNAVLLHHESASRGSDKDPEKARRLAAEQTHLIETWKIVRGEDPYTNPHVFNWI